MRKKQKELRSDIEELNRKYFNKTLLNESFYDQLSNNGIFPENSMLINMYPDSSNTYIVELFTNSLTVLRLDLDLDFPEYSIIENITDEFMIKAKVKSTKESVLLAIFKESGCKIQ